MKHIGYSLGDIVKTKTLSDLTEDEKKVLYPYALVLAALDGNTYIGKHLDMADSIEQYIPDVHAVLEANGLDISTMRDVISRAAK